LQRVGAVIYLKTAWKTKKN